MTKKLLKQDAIRLVIFDLDGTLVDAYPAITRSFNYTMRILRYPVQGDAVIRRAVGWGDKNLLRPFVQSKDFSRAVMLYRRHHRASLLKGTRLFPGAGLLLRRLKDKGYLLAVASNRPGRFARIVLRHVGIRRLFSYVLCSDKLKTMKPHPEILKVIMKKLGVLARQTLYIGDMAIDAQAGRAARVKTIIVTTGSSSKAEIKRQGPFRVIDTLKGLADLL